MLITRVDSAILAAGNIWHFVTLNLQTKTPRVWWHFHGLTEPFPLYVNSFILSDRALVALHFPGVYSVSYTFGAWQVLHQSHVTFKTSHIRMSVSDLQMKLSDYCQIIINDIFNFHKYSMFDLNDIKSESTKILTQMVSHSSGYSFLIWIIRSKDLSSNSRSTISWPHDLEPVIRPF